MQGLLTVASTPLNHDILDDRTPIPDPCIRTSPIISKPSSGQHKRGENVAAVPHTRRDAFRSREDMSHRENVIVRMEVLGFSAWWWIAVGGSKTFL